MKIRRILVFLSLIVLALTPIGLAKVVEIPEAVAWMHGGILGGGVEAGEAAYCTAATTCNTPPTQCDQYCEDFEGSADCADLVTAGLFGARAQVASGQRLGDLGQSAQSTGNPKNCNKRDGGYKRACC